MYKNSVARSTTYSASPFNFSSASVAIVQQPAGAAAARAVASPVQALEFRTESVSVLEFSALDTKNSAKEPTHASDIRVVGEDGYRRLRPADHPDTCGRRRRRESGRPFLVGIHIPLASCDVGRDVDRSAVVLQFRADPVDAQDSRRGEAGDQQGDRAGSAVLVSLGGDGDRKSVV